MANDKARDLMSEHWRRVHYLRSKGLKEDKNQMDLVFPDLPILLSSERRIIPNEIANSGLFATLAKSDGSKRKSFNMTPIFSLNGNVDIRYTGIQLSASDDLLVYMEVLQASLQVDIGTPFKIKVADILKNLGWANSGERYLKVRQSIHALRSNIVQFHNRTAYGQSPSFSLIENMQGQNDALGEENEYTLTINLAMLLLFAGGRYTRHEWLPYLTMTQTQRKMADYVCAHNPPRPLELESFKQMCSVTSPMRNWKIKVRQAAEGLIVHRIIRNYEICNDKISFTRY